ncbi:MAG: nucleic acid-binding protein [Bacilli bacterium]|nr:nucleic acid-binding protein [Bacilli bacterium]
MRKCLRCESEMLENLEIMVSNGGYGIDVREKGIFKTSLGKIKCAVCPKCGYVENYLEDLEKIKKLKETKNK